MYLSHAGQNPLTKGKSQLVIFSFRVSILVILLLFICSKAAKAEEYSLKSPNGKISVKVTLDENVKWALALNGNELIKPSPISIKLKDGRLLGERPAVKDVRKNSVNEMIEAVVPVKNKNIADKYNELVISFKNDFNIAFRAYDDGAAYRFETSLKDDSVSVEWENLRYNFAGDYRVFFPEEELWDFISHYERVYNNTHLNAIADTQFCSLPVLLAADNNVKLLLTEADLYDYPNMFFYGTGQSAFRAVFPKVTLANKPVNDRDDDIVKLADYIAATRGRRTFPWRVVIISENDKDLLESDLVYKLSTPSVIKNTNWIKPGRVAWDWWNDRNLYGVGFSSGINTDTYKYFIDFASRFGLEYIILDEGWSRTSHDLLNSIAEIDLKEIISYGQKKNVGVILWVLWNALNENMMPVLDQFAAMGVKGIKVDFMQRGDQYMVNYYEKVAREAAKRNLTVDFHGAYKPSGLNRKYPNVLSQEGVKGLENSKWGTDITPAHDVTLPFTRMAAGPMDFTPGAMINANKNNFRAIFSEPMSQGTRCHQAAMYVVYTSPLQMFSDSPSKYIKDTVFTGFIAQMPSVWDNTVGLDSKAGEYVTVARKKDNKWYIGAMTDWNSRKMEIPLTFIEGGTYNLEYVEDGVNANRHASDYKAGRKTIKSGEVLKINLAPGGGWAGILTPVK